MGVDAADWQKQVTVNVSSVGQIPVDIAVQTLPRLLTTPDLRGEKWKRSVVYAGVTAIGATTEVSIGTATTSGIGFALRINTECPDLVFRIYLDSVLTLTGAIEGVWVNWGGLHYEENMKTLITIYDDINTVYSMVRDYGFNYPFTTSCELRVYNPGGAAKNVNNVVMAYLIPA